MLESNEAPCVGVWVDVGGPDSIGLESQRPTEINFLPDRKTTLADSRGDLIHQKQKIN